MKWFFLWKWKLSLSQGYGFIKLTNYRITNKKKFNKIFKEKNYFKNQDFHPQLKNVFIGWFGLSSKKQSRVHFHWNTFCQPQKWETTLFLKKHHKICSLIFFQHFQLVLFSVFFLSILTESFEYLNKILLLFLKIFLIKFKNLGLKKLSK